MSEIDHKEVADLAERLIALKQGVGAAETPSEAQAYKNSLRNACDNHIDLLSRAYLDMVKQCNYWRTLYTGGVGELPLENEQKGGEA